MRLHSSSKQRLNPIPSLLMQHPLPPSVDSCQSCRRCQPAVVQSACWAARCRTFVLPCHSISVGAKRSHDSGSGGRAGIQELGYAADGCAGCLRRPSQGHPARLPIADPPTSCLHLRARQMGCDTSHPSPPHWHACSSRCSVRMNTPVSPGKGTASASDMGPPTRQLTP